MLRLVLDGVVKQESCVASVGALYIIVWSQLLSNTITQRIAVRLRLCLCGVVCGCGVDAAWCECGVVCGCVCVCDTLQWMDGRCAHVKLWPDVLHGRAELPHKLPPEYQRRPGIISYHIISYQTTEQKHTLLHPFLFFPFLSVSKYVRPEPVLANRRLST